VAAPDSPLAKEGPFRLWDRVHDGDAAAASELSHKVAAALAARAGGPVAAGRASQAAALVNDAYLELARRTERTWRDRACFLRTAASVMRQLLIDHVRARPARQRPPDEPRLRLDELVDECEARAGPLLPLHAALERLAAEDREKDRELVQLVELRWFAGLTHAECANTLSVSRATIERRWAGACDRLQQQLRHPPADPDG